MGQSIQNNYRAFLLRMWREGERWRFTLEDPHSGQKHGFGSLPKLVAFLETATNLSVTVQEPNSGS